MRFLPLLLGVCMTVGCASASPPAMEAITEYPADDPPRHVSRLTGQSDSALWSCAVAESNGLTARIDCAFANGHATQTSQVCVIAYLNRDHTSVLAGQRICSGDIEGGRMTPVVSAYLTGGRLNQATQLCGTDLSECDLSVVEYRASTQSTDQKASRHH